MRAARASSHPRGVSTRHPPEEAPPRRKHPPEEAPPHGGSTPGGSTPHMEEAPPGRKHRLLLTESQTPVKI